MRTDHFIAFFTVCGFFIGLMFVVLNVSQPMEILGYTMISTLFFYLIIHVAIMNYIDAGRLSESFFDKEKNEEVNNYLLSELSIREKRMQNLIKIKKYNPMVLEKSDKKKNERKKEKAA